MGVRGTSFWGPYNKDPTNEGSIGRSPIFGNPHLGLWSNKASGMCQGLGLRPLFWGLGFRILWDCAGFYRLHGLGGVRLQV